MKQSIFSIMLKYIAECAEVGSIVERKHLIAIVAYKRNVLVRNIECTVDTYKTMLIRSGYLHPMVLGVFKVIDVPKHSTVSKLRKEYKECLDTHKYLLDDIVRPNRIQLEDFLKTEMPEEIYDMSMSRTIPAYSISYLKYPTATKAMNLAIVDTTTIQAISVRELEDIILMNPDRSLYIKQLSNGYDHYR